MSDSLDFTPETARKRLKELTQQKKRIEQSIQQTGINPLYMEGLAKATIEYFNTLRSQLSTVNDEISWIVNWFNLYLLEQLELSSRQLQTYNSEILTHAKKLDKLTLILIGVTIALAIITTIDLIVRLLRL